MASMRALIRAAHAIAQSRVIGVLRDFEMLSRRFSLLSVDLSALGRRAGALW